jgi:hypothetical protein
LPVDSNTISTPRSFQGSWAGSFWEPVAVHADPAVARLDRRRQITQDRVVLQQVRQRSGVRDVVHGHEVEVPVPESRTHDVAANPAEPVDADPDRHRESSSVEAPDAHAASARRGPRPTASPR